MKDNDGSTPLQLTLTSEFYLKTLEALLAKGADANLPDKNGWTPLHNAMLMGNKAVVGALLKHKANPNAQNGGGESPLYVAVINDRPDAVQLLLEHGADPNFETQAGNGRTPLALAADLARRESGHKEMLQLLVSHKGDPKKSRIGHQTLLEWASESADGELLLILQGKDAALWNAFFEAANAGDVKAMEPLLKKDPSFPNASDHRFAPANRSALECAITSGNADAVRLLLAHEAEVKAHDLTGMTPLHHAIVYAGDSKKEIAEALLKQGAEVNARDNNDSTPLHYARTKELVKLLLDAGADLNAKIRAQDGGHTAFLICAAEGAARGGRVLFVPERGHPFARQRRQHRVASGDHSAQQGDGGIFVVEESGHQRAR